MKDASDDNISLQELIIDDPVLPIQEDKLEPIETSLEPPEEEQKVEEIPKLSAH